MAYVVRRWLAVWAVVMVGVCGLWTPLSAAARQNTPNLLTNGSLETPYYAQGAPTRTVPHGWDLWVGAGAPESVPNKDKPQVLDGAVAWTMQQNGTAFMSAGYQQVAGLTPGDMLRLTAFGWVFTCNDPATACIIPDPPYRRSDATAGVVLRVGIDPTGGNDPLAGGVRWSAAVAPYDQWAEMTVSAAAESDTVTVFLFATQAQGLALNAVYWDNAELVVAAEAAPQPDAVTFVVPQGVRPDGSIVHIIQAGDTLWSIAYAYTDYGVTVESIAALNEGIKPSTRYLTPGAELVILPPGSVDPATGQMVTPGALASLTPTAETLAPTPVAAQATAAPAPTDTPTATPQPTVEPTATPTQAEVPAALTATSGTLCVDLYDDSNTNGVRDTDENDLPGATVSLAGADGEERFTLSADEESHCADRAPGQYTVQVVPPDGFGLTTAGTVLVELASGRRRALEFGAAQGYSLPPLPTPDSPATTTAADAATQAGAVAPLIEVVAASHDRNTTLLDRLYDNSGLLVLGAAGVIALGSALALLALRRPR